MQPKKVILSRGRSQHITTHHILQDFELVVPESEIPDYQTIVKNANEIIGIPDAVVGLGSVRNWILDHYADEVVVMFDDDIKYCVSVLNFSPVRMEHPDEIEGIIYNCALNAYEAGARCFSFSQTCDVRKYSHSQPFLLNSWVGSVVGVIGRELRFTEKNKLKVDIDFTLQNLKKHRIVWVDARFGFVPTRDTNVGGNSAFRSQEQLEVEIQFLKDKWGKHIKVSNNKSKYRTTINVKRTQQLTV
ncbi:MAG: hypothetical protein HGB01_06875 [Chlorobiaceae bacterium]|nr:hypothetical protein [Chlorobiaceae bacterium]